MSVPNSREVQEFQFKLLTRLRVFSSANSQLQFDGNLNLVTAASKYGLIFVGTPSGFNVIKVADIVELQANVKKKPSEFCDYSSRRINLGTQPSHLDVSCDCQLLAVSFVLSGVSQISVYSVVSFTSKEVTVVNEVRCDSRVTCMSWNPAVPSMLAVCLASGVAAVYEFSNVSVNINTASDANAMCLCWSPKGKQVVIGSSKGALSQYKPDLKLFKTFQQPNYCTNPVSVITVQWLSNFQFLAVYKDNVDSNKQPGVVIVNAPKAGPVTYLNYADICYSSGTLRDPQFYIIHQQIWNVIMVASGNSMEVGVLGLESDSWVQWIQEDAARADLPLSSNKQETYVVGMAFDTSAQYKLTYGESHTLPPMPLLILLSHEGLLCLFFAVNTLPSSEIICNPPEPLSDMSGVQFFVRYSEPEIVEDVQYGYTNAAGQNSDINPVVTTQSPNWFTPSPQAVQANQQKLWPNITPSAAPNWMASENTPFLQPQQLSMQGVFQKSEYEKPSAAQVSPAVSTAWASSTAFTQPSIIQQQLLTSNKMNTAAGQELVTMSSLGRNETFGIQSPQITPNSKPQQSPKPLANKREVEPKISNILEQEVVEDSEDAISNISDGVIEATLLETINLFNSDLSELAEEMNINCHIGTPEEKLRFQQSFDSLESFLKELSETTTDHKCEIMSLKNSLFDIFAWVEDARTRVQQIAEQSYVISTELDPVSSQKINSIEHLLYYTNSQLSQIKSKLSDRWGEVEDAQKERKSFELRTPWMESIYQALSLQNNVIGKYSLLLDEIDKKVEEYRNIAQLPRMSKISFESDEYSGDIELSKLAESFLGVKLTRTGKTPKSEHKPVNYETRSIKINKAQKIQELLSDYPVSKIQYPKSFTTKVSNKEPLSGLSLPVTGAKLGGISSGQPIVTKEPNILQDSKSIFATTKASGIKTSQSRNVGNITYPSEGYSDSVSKINAQTYQDIPQFTTAIQDSSDVTPVERLTTDKILDSGFQQSNVVNPESNEYMQPTAVTQNSPLATLSNIVGSIPDTADIEFEGKTNLVKNSKSVFNSDIAKIKENISGVTTSKLAFVKEEDRAKSDIPVLTSSPKISFGSVDERKAEDSSSKLNFGISNPSQNFFKNTSASPEMSKSFFGSSASPFKNVFGGSPLISEMPGLTVSKTNTDIKAPKSVLGTSPGAKNVFGFHETKQAVTTEPVSTESSLGMTKNVFSTKTSVDTAKNILPQSAALSDQNLKIITPVENNKTCKSVFTTVGSTAKDTLSTSTEFKVSLAEQTSVKNAGNEVGVVKPSFVSKPAVEPPKLIFGSSTAGNSALLNSENLGINKIIFSGATSFPKTVSVTTVTSPNGDFVAPQNINAIDSKTDNKYVSAVTSTLSSSSIQEETENIEDKNIFKDKTESIERNEDEQITLQHDTSLPLFGSLSLEQTSALKPCSLGEELLDEPEIENETNVENQNISPVKVTSASVSLAASGFDSLPSMPNTSVNNITNSSSAEVVSSLVSKTETKTVSGTSDIFSKPVSSVVSTVAEKTSATTQAADTFSFSLPAATSVTQAPFTFSLPAASSDKAVASTFRFAPPNTTVTSNVTTSDTFSFGQLASTVTTTTASDKNTKITLSFGNPQTAVSTSTPEFSGFTTSQTTAQSSLFGQPVTTTSTTNTAPETCFSFTISTTAPPQNSFFGNKTNMFGTPTTTTTASSIFGQTVSSPASTANSPFGQTASVFGQAASSTSPFGSSSAFNTKPAFGQSGGSLFGQTSSSGFNSSGASIFGGSSMFGASSNNTSGGNMFQTSGTSSIFGGGSTTPGGSFSSGGQSISQAGFGSPSAFQNKPAGTFGGAPAFGSAPSFGGAPTFGGSPTFGSPNKVFGSTVPSSGFGSTQQSTTFENLATQNTMTFGNLAQASSGSAFGSSMFGGNAPQSQASSTFSSGSTSFGGSSFSSWR